MIAWSGLHSSLETAVPALAGAMMNSVWQGLLLAGGVGLVLRCVRRISPAVRATVWAAVLLLLLVLPVLTLTMHIPGMAGGASLKHEGIHLAQSWSLGVLAVWLTLSLLRAVQLGWHGMHLWRLAVRATPVAVDGDLAALLRGRRSAKLCVSPEVNRPSVAGFFRSRVLLPVGMLQTLSPAELQHVVLHEMEHLRRGDDWLNLLQQISLVLLPLQPALVWVDRELCRERELACDDGVLAATHAHKEYAACLVKLAEDSLLRKGVALALSALGTQARESELVGRVRRILGGANRVTHSAGTRLTLAGLSLGTVACAALLVHGPEWIQFDGHTTPPMQAAMRAPSVLPALRSGADAPFPVRGADVLYSAERTSLADGSMASAHPVLTRAVLPGSGLPQASLVSAVATPVMRNEGSVRVPARRSTHKAVVASIATPRSVQTKISLVRRSAAATALVKAAYVEDVPHAAEDQPGRVVMTEFVISQPVYAAVAVGGGWLVLQL